MRPTVTYNKDTGEILLTGGTEESPGSFEEVRKEWEKAGLKFDDDGRIIVQNGQCLKFDDAYIIMAEDKSV